MRRRSEPQRQRPPQDRHVAIASFPLAAAPPDGCQRAFFAVYDGHNGAKAADIAAARMHVVLGAQVPLRSVDGAASDRAKVDGAFPPACLLRLSHLVKRKLERERLRWG